MGRFRSEKVIRASLCCFLAACLSAPAAAQDPVIRVNVRLVRMLVTVKDAAGQLIGSLNKGDFAVSDNGVKQDIAVFDRASLNASQSVHGTIKPHRDFNTCPLCGDRNKKVVRPGPGCRSGNASGRGKDGTGLRRMPRLPAF